MDPWILDRYRLPLPARVLHRQLQIVIPGDAGPGEGGSERNPRCIGIDRREGIVAPFQRTMRFMM